MTSPRTIQRDHFESILRARENELRERIHRSLIDSDNKDYAELAGRVRDMGDQSVVDLVADVDIGILQKEVEEIADVHAALQRLRDGRYGVCIDCGEEVGVRRLEAYPTAKRCRSCQARHENRARDMSPSL